MKTCVSFMKVTTAIKELNIALKHETEGETVAKGMVTEIRTAAGPGIEIEIGEIGIVPGKVPNAGVVVDPKIDMRIGD